MIAIWTLPPQEIRALGTTAADLFELLATLAVDGIVRGLTVTGLADRFCTEFDRPMTYRTANGRLKRLEEHGLIEIERYSKDARDADLRSRDRPSPANRRFGPGAGETAGFAETAGEPEKAPCRVFAAGATKESSRRAIGPQTRIRRACDLR